jgi:hypothetical protein
MRVVVKHLVMALLILTAKPNKEDLILDIILL